MANLEEIISVVLAQRKPQLAPSSFESLNFYCKQLSQMASKMNSVSPKYKKIAHPLVRIMNSRIPCDFFAGIRLFMLLRCMFP